MYNDYGSLTLANVVFWGYSADDTGGGMHNYYETGMDLRNSIL